MINVNPYYTALIAMTLNNIKDDEGSLLFCHNLAKMQDRSNGVVFKDYIYNRGNDQTTVTYSYGDDYLIAATSLAVLAWIRYKETFDKNITEGMNYILSKCMGGRFGSTHSTILALKAILASENKAYPDIEGHLHLTIDHEPIGKYPIGIGQEELIVNLEMLAKMPTNKKHHVALKLENIVQKVTCTTEINFRNTMPNNHPDCSLTLQATLAKNEILEGEGMEVEVTITNIDREVGLPMTVAMIGLPGGLEPRFKHLQELVEAQMVDFFEIRDRFVVFYLREMGPGQVHKFSFDVIAMIPGVYAGEASYTYLYYTDGLRNYTEPLSVNIIPK